MSTPHFQTSEILYSHHNQYNVDTLIIKLTLSRSSPSYEQDFINGFPNFEFHTPMMFRRTFKLNERNHIFRTRMTTFVKIFTIANVPRNHLLRSRLSEFDYYRFDLQLNDELRNLLPKDLMPLFNDNVLSTTAICVLNQVFQLGLIYDQSVKASAAESQQIFDYMMEDNDPSVKILKDFLPLEKVYNLSILCSTNIIKTDSTNKYNIKLLLAC